MKIKIYLKFMCKLMCKKFALKRLKKKLDKYHEVFIFNQFIIQSLNHVNYKMHKLHFYVLF